MRSTVETWCDEILSLSVLTFKIQRYHVDIPFGVATTIPQVIHQRILAHMEICDPQFLSDICHACGISFDQR